MTRYIRCDNCGKAVAHGSAKVWAYGSMRYCNGKCLVAAFHENIVEPKMLREKRLDPKRLEQPKQTKKVKDWTAARLKYLEEERLKHAK